MSAVPHFALCGSGPPRGPVHGRINSVYVALVPCPATLAFAMSTPLDLLASEAPDVSISIKSTQLHVFGFPALPTVFARKDSGTILRLSTQVFVGGELLHSCFILRGFSAFPSDCMIEGNSGSSHPHRHTHKTVPIGMPMPVLENPLNSFAGAAGLLPEDAFNDYVILFFSRLAISSNRRLVPCYAKVSQPQEALPFCQP